MGRSDRRSRLRARLAGHHGAGSAVRAEINITPLVDVVLVLLIIFMIVTPLMARGKEVPLPKTSFHNKDKDKMQPVVAIDGNGDLWFDKEKLGPAVGALPLMKTKVQEAWDSAKVKEGVGKISLKVAEEVTYGQVYPVLIALNKDLDLAQIDLATNEKKEK